VLERVLDLVHGEPSAEEMEEKARVDRAGTRRHDHALEGRKPHGRVDRAPSLHRGDRTTAAQVANDEALNRHPLGRPLDRDPVKSKSTQSLVSPASRDRVRGRDAWEGRVKGRVEDRDVRSTGKERPRLLDRAKRRPIVERREIAHLNEPGGDVVVDDGRLDVALAAVDDSVADDVDGTVVDGIE
jgi:hypothetical protein